MNSELAAALAGALVGAVIGSIGTYLGAVRVARVERQGRLEDEERARSLRRIEIREALAAALERNIEILDAIPETLGRVNKENPLLPQNVDLALLDATGVAKFELLDTPACAAVDLARARLDAVRRAMEHHAHVWSLTSLGIQVGQSSQEMAAKQVWSNCLLEGLRADVCEKLVPRAVKACKDALQALRRHSPRARPGAAATAPAR